MPADLSTGPRRSVAASDGCTIWWLAAAPLSAMCTGVLIPGGFGISIEGKTGAIAYARARGLPVLAVPGLQCIVIEAARWSVSQRQSAEFDPDRSRYRHDARSRNRGRRGGSGGTMRLGSYPAVLEPDSVVAQA